VILGHLELLKRLQNDLIVNPLDPDQVRENGIDLSIGDPLTIEPKAFALAKTREWVEFPTDLVGLCNLRSTYSRRGLLIPPTVVDAGFKGKLVIEIVNLSNQPYTFKQGERFLHLIVAKCQGAKPYNGKYQYQT
jgi:dCTP deaminase